MALSGSFGCGAYSEHSPVNPLLKLGGPYCGPDADKLLRVNLSDWVCGGQNPKSKNEKIQRGAKSLSKKIQRDALIGGTPSLEGRPHCRDAFIGGTPHLRDALI